MPLLPGEKGGLGGAQKVIEMTTRGLDYNYLIPAQGVDR